MDFVVDKVSEDSFFLNILTGLPKLLEKFKKIGMTTHNLIRKMPISHSEICVWEQKQAILLPDDLRNFYNSCNGFLFTWILKFGNDQKEITGKVEVNGLENLIQLTGYEPKHDPGVIARVDRFQLRLGAASRIFELQAINKNSKVVLVYLNSRYSPTIWVTSGQEFYFLADDFTTYFRMSLAHIGIPNWQLLFTPKGIPQWTENMTRLLAPHLLKSNRTLESARKQREIEIIQEHVEIPVNELEVAIFKCLPRLPHGLPRVIEKEKVVPSKMKRDKFDKEVHNKDKVSIAREKSFSTVKSQLQGVSQHKKY